MGPDRLRPLVPTNSAEKQKGRRRRRPFALLYYKCVLRYELALAANWLDYSEITPLAVDRLQLVDPAIVSVQKVAAIRDRMVMRGADRATSPTATTGSSPATAMFAGFFAEFDAVLDLVLDASETGWNQPPISLQLFFSHDVHSTHKTGERFAGMRRPQSISMIFGTRTQDS